MPELPKWNSLPKGSENVNRSVSISLEQALQDPSLLVNNSQNQTTVLPRMERMNSVQLPYIPVLKAEK